MKPTKDKPYIYCEVNENTLRLKKDGFTASYHPFVNDWTCYNYDGTVFFAVLPKDVKKNYLKYLEVRKKELSKQIEKLKLAQKKVINQIVKTKSKNEL